MSLLVHLHIVRSGVCVAGLVEERDVTTGTLTCC